jgi:serpin B
VSLLIANSLWLNQNFCFEPAFLTPTQQCYAAKVTNADFHAPTTVSDINQWVKENTQGKIGPVVQTLDPLTALLIINAIYFKGRWAKPFDQENTKERDFTLLTGEKKLMPMMSQSDDYRYYQGHNYQAVRLPYRESEKPRLSMTIFLPKRGTRLSNFPLLNHWQEWRTGSTFREGTIVLVTLNGALSALGMAEAFSQDQADFSQMAKVPKSQNLYISNVEHQAFVEVNEEGTVAAAVTYSDMRCTSAAKPEPFEMIVDHPFFFTIQDDGTGTVLFLGAIVEPK